MSVVYINGNFLEEEKALIPIFDRGFLFGDGVFTTIKVENGRPEFLFRHIEKLENDCKIMGIIPKKIVHKDIMELIQRNEAQKGVFRLKIIFTGGGNSRLELNERCASYLIMTLKPYKKEKDSYRLCSFPTAIRNAFNGVKTLSQLDRLLIADYALKQGAEDCLVFSNENYLLETSFANIFWCVNQKVFYPDYSLPLYPGVTLNILIEIFKAWNWEIYGVKAQLEEIPKTAQLYLCNSLKQVLSIVKVDHQVFQPDFDLEKKLLISYFKKSLEET